MDMTRDANREAVYEVERTVERILRDGGEIQIFGATFDVPVDPLRKLGTLEGAQRYLDTLWQMPWVDEYGIEKPRLRRRRGVKKAHYERGSHTIALPETEFGLSESTLLHECAHALTPGDGHQKKFQRALAHLYNHAVAPIAGMLVNYYADLETGRV